MGLIRKHFEHCSHQGADQLDWSLPAHRRGTLGGMDAATELTRTHLRRVLRWWAGKGPAASVQRRGHRTSRLLGCFIERYAQRSRRLIKRPKAHRTTDCCGDRDPARQFPRVQQHADSCRADGCRAAARCRCRRCHASPTAGTGPGITRRPKATACSPCRRDGTPAQSRRLQWRWHLHSPRSQHQQQHPDMPPDVQPTPRYAAAPPTIAHITHGYLGRHPANGRPPARKPSPD
ncbi:hypothetical protein [Xanthomonas oryzae pv. oryzae MAFF 311018]|nr:hypothetical protein [Xanthomonas oryzae pv. oryzae MAFF 311018]